MATTRLAIAATVVGIIVGVVGQLRLQRLPCCDNGIFKYHAKDNHIKLKQFNGQKNDETCNPEYHLAYRRYRFLLHLCKKHPSVALAAIYGLQQAVKQCQFQMKNNRWDCRSGFSSRMNTDFTLVNDPPMIKYGYKETAFLVALSSAGVTWSVARACVAGNLTTCKCNMHQHTSQQNWEWGGCSYSVKYGLVMARKVLTPRKTTDPDVQNLLQKVHKHNLKAGRLAVKKTLAESCKCHGVSGSCQMKTCWKATADLREIGDHLMKKYKEAKFLLHNNSPNDSRHFISGHVKSNDLAYFEQSPTYCETSSHLKTSGTSNRVCNVRNDTHDFGGDCDLLCCGRGYYVYKENVQENCDCIFHWCCHVTCRQCIKTKKISKCR